ncbi:unnamed protein product [Owenia fusiformis]|uniref:Autophagy-related protein 27 n=1 Tax=Owenia fusiformis TaxID=6347 RepID=A0A8J1XVM1_OWEFU|nr:unnamed protein product [Owenia fusiformis]
MRAIYLSYIVLSLAGLMFDINESVDPQNIVCTSKISSCACQTDDGIIDLSPLDTKDPSNPALKEQYDPNNKNHYSWNPCSGFSMGNCTDVASCQQDNHDHIPLGTQDDAQFVTDPDLGLEITYSASWYDTIRTAHIQLLCDPTADSPTYDVQGETKSRNYMISVTSKYCCPQQAPPVTSPPAGQQLLGISIGTILCIALAVIVPTYFIVGMAVMHRRGATGTAMVPNVEFWKGIPSLVKDGTMFLVTKVTKRGEYNRM